MRAILYPQGTRVEIVRGDFPLDPDLPGRTGTVVRVDDHRPQDYGIVLDGESEVRDFHESELKVVEMAGSLDERGDAGPTVGPGQTAGGA